MRIAFENKSFALPVVLGSPAGRVQKVTEGEATYLKLYAEYMEYGAAYTYAVEVPNTDSEDEVLIQHAEKELIHHKFYHFSTILKPHVESAHLNWDDNSMCYCVEIISSNNWISINFDKLALAMEVYNAISGWLLFKEY